MWKMSKTSCRASRSTLGISKVIHARPRPLMLSFTVIRCRDIRRLRLSRLGVMSEARGTKKVTRLTLSLSMISIVMSAWSPQIWRLVEGRLWTRLRTLDMDKNELVRSVDLSDCNCEHVVHQTSTRRSNKSGDIQRYFLVLSFSAVRDTLHSTMVIVETVIEVFRSWFMWHSRKSCKTWFVLIFLQYESDDRLDSLPVVARRSVPDVENAIDSEYNQDDSIVVLLIFLGHEKISSLFWVLSRDTVKSDRWSTEYK